MVVVVADAGDAVELAPHALASDIEQPLDVGAVHIGKLQRGAQPHAVKPPLQPAPDAPDVAGRSEGEGFAAGSVVGDTAHAPVCRIPLGKSRRHLGKGLGGRYAQRCGDAGVAAHAVHYLAAVVDKLLGSDVRQMQKCLVDRVYLHLRHHSPQGGHYPRRHVAVQAVVAREYSHIVASAEALDLEVRVAAAYAQRLGLVGEGDGAAVVVAEHYHRAPVQAGTEYPLARHEEIVAVDKPVHTSVRYGGVRGGAALWYVSPRPIP